MPKGLYEFATNFWTWVWSRPPLLNKFKKKTAKFLPRGFHIGVPSNKWTDRGHKNIWKVYKVQLMECSLLFIITQCAMHMELQQKWFITEYTLYYTLYYYTEGGPICRDPQNWLCIVIYGQPLIRRKYHSHDDNICNNGSFLEYFIGRDAISAVHGPYMMRGNM